VRVVTADDNDAGLRLYAAAGFVEHARVEVHAGVPQRVLVWTAAGPDASAGNGSAVGDQAPAAPGRAS
jgi:hypothetical protein